MGEVDITFSNMPGGMVSFFLSITVVECWKYKIIKKYSTSQ